MTLTVLKEYFKIMLLLLNLLMLCYLCYRRMNNLHVQMERLVEKDTFHVLQDEVSLPYWPTVDKTHASLLIRQSVTLITSPAKVHPMCLKLYLCNRQLLIY